MIRTIRTERRRGKLTIFVAVLTFTIMGDLHAFAAEPNPSAVANREEAQSSQRLVTIEEVYTGMLEAEQRRATMARADPAVDNAKMAKQWGVQVISVSYAADGFWLGFRFRVIDPEKAQTLFDTKVKPYLESEANGVKLGVPNAAKIGALRTTNRGHNVKAGKIYNIMFSNPGFLVQPGQKVTVVAGDFRVENLTVRGSRENLSINKPALQDEK